MAAPVAVDQVVAAPQGDDLAVAVDSPVVVDQVVAVLVVAVLVVADLVVAVVVGARNSREFRNIGVSAGFNCNSSPGRSHSG